MREGAKLIVLDPRRIDLVRSTRIEAAHHLPLRPGTNVAMMNAMAHVIVTEGLVDEDYRGRALRHRRIRPLARVRRREDRNSPGGAGRDNRCDARNRYPRSGTAVRHRRQRGAIYYGLGVTEHSQGSTMVMAMANLAMATGNVGREGVGVNPLRGQNNVQGSCDMGSFPHELPGYRHVSDAARATFEADWGVGLDEEPGLRIPNMFDQRPRRQLQGLYVPGRGHRAVRSEHGACDAALEAMDCVVVQDLFLNETAAFAHVFLPGTSFLEKDGTFTNAERRINRVRPVSAEKTGLSEWEAVCRLARAMGYAMHYDSAAAIMDEIARLAPTFSGVSHARLDREGSLQWPVNDQHPNGAPIMHVGGFVRGKGRFMVTEYVPTTERANRHYPLILTTGRILTQYNVGAQTRRTENLRWHDEDVLELHPFDAGERGIEEGDMVSVGSRIGATTLRASISDKMPQGVVYTTFHHPLTGANVITTENSDWATNCPEYKVTAVQVVRSNQPSRWQEERAEIGRRNFVVAAAE
jgi:formate dehydrogenase major subunit